MALSDLPFKPGIFTEATDREDGKYAFWKNGEKVRFFNGRPQKLGGWEKASATQFVGKARATLDWATSRQELFTAVGTHKKLYIVQGETFFDITPIQESGTLGTNPFAVTDGSATVTVTDTAHGRAVGDYVHFSGATAVGGITITGEYVVATVPTSGSYTITHSSNANATTSGGGAAVAYQYEISIGNEYSIVGLGWGAGGWDESTWDTARSSSGLVLPSRLWSLAVWGEDLLASPYDGAIYVWDSSGGTGARATLITQAPSTNKSIFVVPDYRQVVALGAHDGSNSDPLLIRWCSQEDYTDWTPTLLNTAGDKRLEYGNEVVCGIGARAESLLFTDTWLYSMTAAPLPDIYGFTPIGANNGICGPHAAIVYNGVGYWMTVNGFYAYDGVVRDLSCTVLNHVYDNFNTSAARHVYAAINAKYSEVWWLYASEASNEIDKYVIYNTKEKCWYYGSLARTALVGDSKYVGNAYALGSDGYLYNHENGVNADGAALEAYLESGDIEIPEAGEYLMHVSKFIPDMLAISGEVDFTLTGKKYPQDSETQTSGPHVISSTTKFVNPRVRCRQISLKFSSDGVDDDWRLGLIRIDAVKHGKR